MYEYVRLYFGSYSVNNHLFQKDRGKTASAARILSPNPTRRPLPCLLIKSFFYGQGVFRAAEKRGRVYILLQSIVEGVLAISATES